MNGDWGEDRPPDLDLDHPTAGEAQVVALFRDGLGARSGSRPDLRAIESRARRRHRRRQAVASGLATTAAALAVMLVVAPWSLGSQDRGAPARPRPTVTAPPVVPAVTKVSLLRPEDLHLQTVNGGPYLDGQVFALSTDPAENLAGRKFELTPCAEDYRVEAAAPTSGWKQNYTTPFVGTEPPRWSVTETVLQWRGRPDQASALREQLKAAAAGCSDENSDGVLRATWSGSLNLPSLETVGANSEGTTLARDVVVVGDTVVILEVGAWAGDLSSRISANTFGWLFPAATRLVGEVPEPGGAGGPLSLRPGASGTGAGE